MSPDFTAADLKARDAGQAFSDDAMWSELGRVNLMRNTRFATPIFIFEGRHDLGTSASLVAKWFRTISAPRKQLIWFDDSAHMVYEEEPGKVLCTLVNQVLPLYRQPQKPHARK